jgi:hypothetical protein
MFEPRLRRAQSFDLLIREKKKEKERKKGYGLKYIFFQKGNQIILTKTKRLAQN